MNIIIRETALESLSKLHFNESEGIRIVTNQEKSCTLFVDYQLTIDQHTEDDEIIVSDGIPFIISSDTKNILPEKIYISYNGIYGYKLSSDEQILKANIDLKK